MDCSRVFKTVVEDPYFSSFEHYRHYAESLLDPWGQDYQLQTRLDNDIPTQGLGSRGQSQLPDQAADVVLYLIQQKAGPSPWRIFYSLSGSNATTLSYLYFNSTLPAKVEATTIGPKFSLVAHDQKSPNATLYEITVEQTPVRK